MKIFKYLFALSLVVVAAMSFSPTAKAASYLVNDLSDTTTCSSTSCSLRGAILQANSTTYDDIIRFDASLSGPHMLTLPSYTASGGGSLYIEAAGGKLTIYGNGLGTAINGNNDSHFDPMIEIEVGADVEIRDLSIVNAHNKAIENNGTLEFTDVLVWGNRGTAITNNGTLTTSGDIRVFGNLSTAIYNSGDLSLNSGTWLSANGGAGIVNENGNVYLDSVEIKFNGYRGIESTGASNSVEIVNSAIYDNGIATGNYPCISNKEGFLSILDSSVENCFGGVANSEGATAVLENVTIEGHEYYGIMNYYNSDFELTDSRVRANDDGIVNSGSILNIKNSTITHNELDGIRNALDSIGEAGTEARVTADNTTISSNGSKGIYNAVDSYVDIYGNSSIDSNGWFGIYNEGYLSVEGSVVENHVEASGITNHGRGEVYISESTIRGNSSGVQNTDKGSVRIGYSVVEGNNGAGLTNQNGGTSAYVPEMSVYETVISENGRSGIVSKGISETYVINSWIDSNETPTSGGAGVRAIDGTTVKIASTTISNNYAAYDAASCTFPYYEGGGGVRVDHSEVTIVNSTISGNSADKYGGGINVIGVSSNLEVVSSTITNNVADVDDDSTSEVGGGIYHDTSYSGTVALKNTIVYGNENTEEPDCYGTIDSDDYNIIGELSSCSFATASNDQIGEDPMLDDLGDDGGFGTTHSLEIHPDSSAIDKIPAAFCMDFDGAVLITDQRGVDRSIYCDIGAYEVEDADNDLMPDEWEEWMGLDTTADDSDSDLDGDGYSNYEEYLGNTDAANSSDIPFEDYDGDGIEDEDDACPTEDATGYDTDSDGCIDDTDGDGLYADEEDTYGSSDSDTDSDDDGLDDYEEVYTHGTDPMDEDTDGDDMDDAWEVEYGFDPVATDESGDDEDGDGLTNLEEYELMYDPTLEALILHDADDVTSCAPYRDGTNIATDTSTFVEGAGSVSFDVDVSRSSNDSGLVDCSYDSILDFSDYVAYGGTAKFWVYIPDATNFTEITLMLASDSSGYSNRYEGTMTAPINNDGVFQDGWNLMEVDFSTFSSVGSPDAADMQRFGIIFSYDAAYTDQTGFRFDALVIE